MRQSFWPSPAATLVAMLKGPSQQVMPARSLPYRSDLQLVQVIPW